MPREHFTRLVTNQISALQKLALKTAASGAVANIKLPSAEALAKGATERPMSSGASEGQVAARSFDCPEMFPNVTKCSQMLPNAPFGKTNPMSPSVWNGSGKPGQPVGVPAGPKNSAGATKVLPNVTECSQMLPVAPSGKTKPTPPVPAAAVNGQVSDQQRAVARLLGAGMRIGAAAAQIGISRQTINRWNKSEAFRAVVDREHMMQLRAAVEAARSARNRDR